MNWIWSGETSFPKILSTPTEIRLPWEGNISSPGPKGPLYFLQFEDRGGGIIFRFGLELENAGVLAPVHTYILNHTLPPVNFLVFLPGTISFI